MDRIEFNPNNYKKGDKVLYLKKNIVVTIDYIDILTNSYIIQIPDGVVCTVEKYLQKI